MMAYFLPANRSCVDWFLGQGRVIAYNTVFTRSVCMAVVVVVVLVGHKALWDERIH